MADIAVDARSFSWAVDGAIASESASDMGESCVRSFSSVVDSAIRSSSATEADFETSPITCFAFASAVTKRIVAERLSQAVSDGTGHVHTRLFTLAELKAATNNFSLHNKIFCAGSISVVHRGKLFDGREVAVKRAETSSKKKEFQEVFGYLSTLLPCLRHNHLVGLVGFCKEKDKRFSVYEYMKNGALYDHLHDKNNVDKESSVLNSWRMRIKIALDASRGIEHLHKYVVPSIIHRDITSSNILLDDSWTAKVSGFESSCFMSPEPEHVYTDTSVLKAKSDVYGVGVVLLELLTGKKTTLKYGRNRGGSMVNVARRAILGGKMVEILDPRVGTPNINEEAGLELVAQTAINCVNLKRKDRPTMTEVVTNLETALSICDTGQ
ncbi:putative serine/threonine-protein kinase-like protein CCR3 [Vigna unguiculata]|uniref:putative serine/threonine-protein kinase-like protein CCR3 n=1 Tax=Vigna unguiculata TaxID=3917 RepID=UPI001016C8D7|nr:putative serine/threonine-protein kinase-like protein CCR3 [Vigna unguiculata]